MFTSRTGNATSKRKIALVLAIAGAGFVLESAVAYEFVARPLASGVAAARTPAEAVSTAAVPGEVAARPAFVEDIEVRAPQGWRRLGRVAGRSSPSRDEGAAAGELRTIDGQLAYCVPADSVAK
jgi:hypothetical protein